MEFTVTWMDHDSGVLDTSVITAVSLGAVLRLAADAAEVLYHEAAQATIECTELT